MPFDIIYQISKESQKIRIEDVMLLKTTKAEKKELYPAMCKILPTPYSIKFSLYSFLKVSLTKSPVQ